MRLFPVFITRVIAGAAASIVAGDASNSASSIVSQVLISSSR